MTQNESWLLPEGVEEGLPEESRATEALRRRVLDLYASWGYDLVYPPLIEFLDSLLTGTGQDLERETFKLTDQLSGKLMGVRADITPQVARMDAHSIGHEGVNRLCYCSTALRTRPARSGASRLPYQIGVELFGHDGVESDLEVVGLMLETLQMAGCSNVTLDLGHVAIYRNLAREHGFSGEQERELRDILRRKALPDLNELAEKEDISARARDDLALLLSLCGGVQTLDQAEQALAGRADVMADALKQLRTLVEYVQQAYPDTNLYLDLGELRGYHYHTGCIFSAYVAGHSQSFARGGRYDHIGEVYGRARPATGFSADLKLLTAASLGRSQPEDAGVVYAQGPLDESGRNKVRELRSQGQSVVVLLPGEESNGKGRRLEQQGQIWQIVDA